MTTRLAGKHFTDDQVATELGLSVHTIRAWRQQRRLQYVKLGRAVRIPLAEVRRLLDEGTVARLDSGAVRLHARQVRDGEGRVLA
jgi:excisionase family DNA binding protein